jgi:hypothetical protein
MRHGIWSAIGAISDIDQSRLTGAETKPSAPAEPATTGARPNDVPPQPARPNADAQKAGAEPILPPAPAEKAAPPINAR